MSDQDKVSKIAEAVWRAMEGPEVNGIHWDDIDLDDQRPYNNAANAVLDLIESGGLEEQMEELADWAFEIELMSPVNLAYAYLTVTHNEMMDKGNQRMAFLRKRVMEFKQVHPDEWEHATAEARKLVRSE